MRTSQYFKQTVFCGAVNSFALVVVMPVLQSLIAQCCMDGVMGAEFGSKPC